MDEPVAPCAACGASNALPAAALVVGRFRCHRCGASGEVPAALRRPHETPSAHVEPVQSDPSATPSAHNTPAALADTARRQGWVSCSVVALGLVAGPLGVLCWLGGWSR